MSTSYMCHLGSRAVFAAPRCVLSPALCSQPRAVFAAPCCVRSPALTPSTAPMSLPCHSSSGTSTLFTATFGPGPLGLQLRRIEGTNDTEEMAFDRFGVGFAIVHSMSDGDTAAHAAGVRPGDIIVGCSGARAFRLDPSTLLPPSLSPSIKEEEGETFAVVCKTLTSYEGLLDKIKAHDRVTAPLVLMFCRCPFNHRSHSWRRFLTARDLLVPASEEVRRARQNEASVRTFCALKLAPFFR